MKPTAIQPTMVTNDKTKRKHIPAPMSSLLIPFGSALKYVNALPMSRLMDCLPDYFRATPSQPNTSRLWPEPKPRPSRDVLRRPSLALEGSRLAVGLTVAARGRTRADPVGLAVEVVLHQDAVETGEEEANQ